MRSFAETNVFDADELRLFERAIKLVETINERTVKANLGMVDDYRLRCHEVTRAIAHVLKARTKLEFEIVDGQYGGADHTWIRLDASLHGDRILDVYAVGSLPQVRLVDLHFMLQHGDLYRPDEMRSGIDAEVVSEIIAQISPCAICDTEVWEHTFWCAPGRPRICGAGL